MSSLDIDLRAITDDELAAHRVDVLGECERRRQLTAISSQVRDLSRTYVEGGGDPAILEQAISGGEDEVSDGA